MFNFERMAATKRLEDAIHFRRMGGGYWYFDLLVDRHAAQLVGVQYHPVLTEDEVITQFADKAWVQFNEPLGQKKMNLFSLGHT